MRVGFTGTREGLTDPQLATLKKLLGDIHALEGISEFHHGDCVGADERAHELVYRLKKKNKSITIVAHPPIHDQYRANVGSLNSKHKFKREKEKEYLARNFDIVNASDGLIACPKDYKEITFSGTWATVRAAKRNHLQFIFVIYPDGGWEDVV